MLRIVSRITKKTLFGSAVMKCHFVQRFVAITGLETNKMVSDFTSNIGSYISFLSDYITWKWSIRGE